MTEQTPWARLAARNEWQGGNVGGTRMSAVPPMSMIRAWETKMPYSEFYWKGRMRRAWRMTYRERLTHRLIVGLWAAGIAFIAFEIVWGMMTP